MGSLLSVFHSAFRSLVLLLHTQMPLPRPRPALVDPSDHSPSRSPSQSPSLALSPLPLPLPISPLSPIPTRSPTLTRLTGGSLLSPSRSPLNASPDPFRFLPSPPPDDPPVYSPPPSPPTPSSSSSSTSSSSTPVLDGTRIPLPSSPSPAPPVLHISIPPPGTLLDTRVPEAQLLEIPEPDHVDLSFDDDSLSPLEKIYLFSRSQANFHKVYILQALPSVLPQISPAEAVEYVIPLLNSLAMDEDEEVKQALASQLVQIVWWYATNCRLVCDDDMPEQAADPTPVPAQTFTPVIGTLLLSSSAVAVATRTAVVDILRRIRDCDLDNVLLGPHERKLLEHEIIHQVVVGIGRLDMADGGTADDHHLGAVIPPEPTGIVHPESDSLTQSELHPHAHAHAPGPPDHANSTPPEPANLTRTFLVHHAHAEHLASPSEAATAARPTPLVSAADAASRDPDPSSAAHVFSSGITEGQGQASFHIGQHPSHRQSVARPQFERPSSPVLDVLGGGHLPLDDIPPDDFDPIESVDDVDAEQAAVGRLSTVNLIAAVTAGGLMPNDTVDLFVNEVERIGQDPMYWVRKEASYALGALAKVIPQELVISSLLPLFEDLSFDPEWHVRHTALFALPAILSRLGPKERRQLALRVVLPLSKDLSEPIRIRLLETLGEVIYTFSDDPGGPPDEILQLYIGTMADTPPIAPPSPPVPVPTPSTGPIKRPPLRQWSDPPLPTPSPTPPNDDGLRPLIRAFNIPAVALTLGRDRWNELRVLYANLAASRESKVHRTLAASAGALARVLGKELAYTDVFPVWITCVHSEEAEVRIKAIESSDALVEVLGLNASTDTADKGVLGVLEAAWQDLTLGWREREKLMLCLKPILDADTLSLNSTTREDVNGLSRMVVAALVDKTAAVRQAAISVVPVFLRALSQWPDLRELFLEDVYVLADSSVFRCRMTFVGCFRELVFAALAGHDAEAWISDARFLARLHKLAADSIIDVRIGVARFVGQVYDQLYRSRPAPEGLESVLALLRADASADVRAFVPVAGSGELQDRKPSLKGHARREYPFATFSLPPPPSSMPGGRTTGRVSTTRIVSSSATDADVSAHPPRPSTDTDLLISDGDVRHADGDPRLDPSFAAALDEQLSSNATEKTANAHLGGPRAILEHGSESAAPDGAARPSTPDVLRGYAHPRSVLVPQLFSDLTVREANPGHELSSAFGGDRQIKLQ